MLYGVIDVGSNSIRLSIYQVEGDTIKSLMNKKEMAGLASYREKGELARAGIDKTCAILSGFSGILKEVGVQRCAVFATQSLRGIKNRGAVLAQIERETGFAVQVISGDEEARLDFIGATSNMPLQSGVLVDIGGGSTELVAFEEGAVQNLISLPLGSLGLYTQYANGLFPNEGERTRMKNAVQEALEALNWPQRRQAAMLCGVGGTARAVGKLSYELLGTPKNSRELPAGNAQALYERLCGDVAQQRAVLRVVPERVFTILPGLILLSEAVRYFGCQTMVVSERGVREGYLIHRLLG